MQKQNNSLHGSLAAGFLIFNFWIPFIFFGPIWEYVRFGFITTGGVSESCSSVDFDPRAGGNNCEGEDYNFEPVEVLNLTQALGRIFSQYLMVMVFTMSLGLIVGAGYHYSNRK